MLKDSEAKTRVGLVPKLRTLALLAHSIVNSGQAGRGNVWDSVSNGFFDNLVVRLSNPYDPERRIIKNILEDFNPSSVLDSGCGPATEYSSYLSSNYLKEISYTGLDGSTRMLALASKRYPQGRFVRGDINQLPFKDGSFDVVVLKHVLEHQRNGYTQAVSEAVRVAKIGIIISFFHSPLPFLPDLKIYDREGCPNHWYNAERFRKFLGSLPVTVDAKRLSIGMVGQAVSLYGLNLHK